MNEYTIHSAKMVPLDRSNIDTDQIIPKQFLKSIKKTGFGPNLFDSWRYLDSGYPGPVSYTHLTQPTNREV